MEEVKMDYGEAEKILKKRLVPMATSLGEKIGDGRYNPLNSENFVIEIGSSKPSWAGHSDYSEVNLSIVTTEYPKVRRKVNKIDTKTGDLKEFKKKLIEIIAESKKIRAEKRGKEQEHNERVKVLMTEFKEFDPKNEGWGISIQAEKLRFEINGYRDEVKIETTAKRVDIAEIIRRLK